MPNQSYGSGTAINDPPLLDGYVAWVTGNGSVNIPVATAVGSATSLAVQNMSNRYVRIFMNPGSATSMIGNRSVLVAPGGTYDASFDVSSLTDITLDLPQMPAIVGSNFTAVDPTSMGVSATGTAMVLISFG